MQIASSKQFGNVTVGSEFEELESDECSNSGDDPDSNDLCDKVHEHTKR